MSVTRRRVYPVVVLLAALGAGALGLYPHVRFSIDSEALEYFFYSYDEGFYSSIGLEAQPGRVISWLVLSGWIGLCQGNLEVALITADFVFPFLTTLAAGYLAAQIATTIAGRVTLVLGLEFAAVYSTHLFESKIPGWDQLLQGPWRQLAVEAQPIHYLFRTPEPQISWLVAFVFLAVLVHVTRCPSQGPSRRSILSFLSLCVLLGLSYTPVFAACAGFAILVGSSLIWGRRWRPALLLLGGAVVSGFVFLGLIVRSSMVGGVGYGGFLFSTSLPVLSPLLLVSVVTLLLWSVRLAAKKSGAEAERLGVLAAVTPILLMNQQVVTGTAVHFMLWEENVSHIFTVLGIAWFFATLGGPAGGKRLAVYRALGSGAALLLGTSLVWFTVKRQTEVLGWFYATNAEESVAVRLLSRNASSLREEERVLFDSVLGDQRLAIRSRNSYRGVLSYDTVFAMPPPTLMTDPARTGAGSPHSAAVFEFMHRRGSTPAEFEAMLAKEVRGHALVLTFFFNQRDAWGPLTSWRARKSEEISARIPEIVAAYRNYLGAARAHPGPPIIWVSSISPSEMEAIPDFHHETLDEQTAVDGRVFYLYRQTAKAPGAR